MNSLVKDPPYLASARKHDKESSGAKTTGVPLKSAHSQE
jgi:hypothetical protein